MTESLEDDLETVCDLCGGSGDREDAPKRARHLYPCRRCKGHGKVPSERGEGLLAFLRRHLHGEDLT